MAYPFVVFEGIDGCGKGVQIARLSMQLRRRRQPFFIHAYPTEAAKVVQDHLSKRHTLSPDALFDAFVADLQADQKLVAQHRLHGWVLADRYCISTAAYQGTDGQLSKRIGQLEKMDWIRPDTVIWLDLKVEEAMARKSAQKSPDRHEADRAFLESVSGNYKELERLAFLCSNWNRIDAAQPPARVEADVRKALTL